MEQPSNLKRSSLIAKLCLSGLFLATPLSALDLKDPPLQALYLMQNRRTEEALTLYREYAKRSGHDFATLQSMGLIFLRQGIQNEDPMIFTMALLGAGLCGSSYAWEILEHGIRYPDPQLQMLSLHFLMQIQDDRMGDLLVRSMSSPYLSTRMESAFYLARGKYPSATGQIEGLMNLLPPPFRPFFPALFALVGTEEANQSLKRLMDDMDPQVRIESILQAAQQGRDDFLPAIRRKLSHSLTAEVEAAAFAVGVLQDSTSIKQLQRLVFSPAENVKIAAVLALHRLGNSSYLSALEPLARKGNLFAIAALGQTSYGTECLADLVKHEDFHVRINAGIALLQQHDPRCLVALKEILIADGRDFAFYPMGSVGRSLSVWRIVSSAALRKEDRTLDLSLSLAMREQVLREIQQLPEKNFLSVAQQILSSQQKDLIPSLVALLENLRTPQAIALLKQGSEQISHPFIRTYCHLALFRLKEPGPHEEYVQRWIDHQKGTDLIRLYPMLPWKMRYSKTDVWVPEEASRLLIESCLAIAQSRNNKSIDFLYEAVMNGNVGNRYALFGLLMRAAE